jgi:hypothetical protein
VKFPEPWYVATMTADEFLLGLLTIGRPLDVSLVGAFVARDEATIRGSQRDIELPLHRDGVYSAALAAVQGGTYVERPGIDVVGLYCLRQGDQPCVTVLSRDGATVDAEYDLKAGEALVFDNRMFHGRRGIVGDRVLLRVWLML